MPVPIMLLKWVFLGLIPLLHYMSLQIDILVILLWVINNTFICYGCITLPDGTYHYYDLPITYTTTYDAVFTPVSPEASPTLAAGTQFTWNKQGSTMSAFSVVLTGNAATWRLSYIAIGI